MKGKIKYLILSQAILFVLFLLVTSCFNRFAVDDYYFIGKLRDSSFQEIYNQLYYHWHGRWTSNFLLIYLLKFNINSLFLPIYNVLSFVLLYIGIIRLFIAINEFYQLKIQKNTLLIYAAIFISILFFCTISPNDTWFWYTSSVVYFWSTIAFFFGFKLFFTQQKKVLDYFVFSASAIYIGGSNEPLAFFIILTLILLVIKKKELALSSWGLILIISSFLINYLSQGTLHRDEITPNLSLVNLILYTGYSSLKFLLFSFHQTYLPAIFLGIPFYLLGKKNNSLSLIRNFNPIRTLFQSVGLIIITVITNQLLVIYVLGGLSPDRSGIASSIVIAIILVRYLFLLGNYQQQKYSVSIKLILVNVLCLICFNIFYFQVHLNYAKSVDERIKLIKESDNKTIYVKALSNPGYLYSAEITSDTTNFKNHHLKEGLGLKNNIILKTN